MIVFLQQSAPLFLATLLGIGTLTVLIFFKLKKPKPKRQVPKDTVLIYGVGRGMAAPSASPFPLKLETFCRMANIPYMMDHSGRMSSKGKTPWMEYNGEAVADSQFCIEHLKVQRHLDLDADLSPSLKAQAHAFRELTEENLYWTMCHALFIKHPENIGHAIPYRGLKLWMIRLLLGWVIRLELWGQGIGRHTDHQIWDIGRRDLNALSDFLGDKKYFCGDEPHEVDCALFGMLCQILFHMPASCFDVHVRENLPNIVAFVERMKSRYWPDWQERCRGSNYVDDSYKLY